MGKLRRHRSSTRSGHLTAVKAFCAGLLSLETHHPATTAQQGFLSSVHSMAQLRWFPCSHTQCPLPTLSPGSLGTAGTLSSPLREVMSNFPGSLQRGLLCLGLSEKL